jgi:hypothetical protein
MQGFQGYGYSKEFVENMTNILERLSSNPVLEIVDECDEICSHCPYNINGECRKTSTSSQTVKSMDIKVLRKLSLRKGDKIRAKDALSLVNEKLDYASLQEICGDCEWKEKCLFFIRKCSKTAK